MHHSKMSEPQGRPRGQGPLRMRSCIAPGDAFSLRRRLSTSFSAAPPQPAHCLFPPHVLQFIILVLSGGAAMQPRSRRAVIVLDALGLAALAALFVLWCVRTPGLSVPGGIAAGCSAALFAAVGLRFVPAWVHFWQREGDAPAAVPAAEPAHMGSISSCSCSRGASAPSPGSRKRSRRRSNSGAAPTAGTILTSRATATSPPAIPTASCSSCSCRATRSWCAR